MRLSRILGAGALGFLAGVFIYSVFGFSWLILFSLIFLTIISGVLESTTGLSRGFLIFAFILGLGLGLARAGSYREGHRIPEKSFWNDSREVLVRKAKTILPFNEASIFNAMVFGYEKDISPETKEDFNRTGTRHILAISGMNISIVVLMLSNLGLAFGLWRRQSFWFSVAGVVAFVLLVGSPPSAVRAGIMGILMLWFKNRGRLVQAWRPVAIAVFFMVFLNPTLLNFSVGFQLSFLAVLGIIYFKNFFEAVFKWIPIKFVRDLVVLSFAAQITTWPVIIYNFGTFSAISPLANIFVVPMLTPIMFLGLGYAAVFWSEFLAKIFLWPVWLILKTVSELVEFFGSFSWASLEIGGAGWVLLIVYYPTLVWFGYFLDKKGLNDPVV